MKVILVGNPNVGKSALFSRLTGTKVITSNYPGTTVGVTTGTLPRPHNDCGIPCYRLVDSPGIYSLDTCEQDAEKVTHKLLRDPAVIVNVIDATNLERNLFLTLQVAKLNQPMIVALNFWDEAQYHGIVIDVKKLSQELGVPVIPTIGITGLGVQELISTINRLDPETKIQQKNCQQKEGCGKCSLSTYQLPQPAIEGLNHRPSWEEIRALVQKVQTVEARSKKFSEYLETMTLSPLWGVPIAIAVLVGSFFIVSYVGEGLETGIEAFLQWAYTPLLLKLHAWASFSPFLQQLLVGTISADGIKYGEAMGLLTSGIFIPLAKVAPVVTAFYFVIGFLEDCGYLPRLAILSDTLMHRFALHGFAIVPMVLGAGCNVTGIMATRILPNRKQRIIASLLLSLTIPCTSQTAMIIGLGEKIGMTYVFAIFGILGVLWYIMGRVLGTLEKNTYRELVMEIPPYRLPHWNVMLRKLSYRLRNFFLDATPITIAGIFVLLVCNYFSVFTTISEHIAPAFTLLWGIPPYVIPVLLMGLYRKEIAFSFLMSFPALTTSQLFVTTLLLALYFPCISVYSVLYREFGTRTLGWMVGMMFLISTIVGTLAHISLGALGL